MTRYPSVAQCIVSWFSYFTSRNQIGKRDRMSIRQIAYIQENVILCLQTLMAGQPLKTQTFGLNEINVQRTTHLSEAFLNAQFSFSSSGFPTWPLYLLSLQSPPPPSSISFPTRLSRKPEVTPTSLVTVWFQALGQGNLSTGCQQSFIQKKKKKKLY